MDIWFWVVVVVGAALIAMVLVSARRSRSRVDPTQVTIDPALAGRIRALTDNGDKLKAVQELRNATGLRLGDAVRIVEKMADAGKKQPRKGSANARTAAKAGSGAQPAGGGTGTDRDRDRVLAGIGPDHIDELRALVGAGQRPQAVTMVRELTGLGHQEASAFVDAL